MTTQQEIERQGVLTIAHNDFAKALNVHAFFKTNSHTLGEGLVQDTFMKTWSYLAKGGKIEVMRAFLYHVLNDLIVDEYRKRKTSSLDIMLEKGFEPGENCSEHSIDLLDGKTAILLIARLPASYQHVMRMRYVQDLSLQEMASATGQSKNSVAVKAFRGLEKLKLLYNVV